jgi:HEAT repeat protein
MAVSSVARYIRRLLSWLSARRFSGRGKLASSDKATLRTLVAGLSHQDIKLRRDSALALGDLGDSHAIRPLTKAFYAQKKSGYGYRVYTQPDDVRMAIAIALYKLGESKELIKVLSSESGYLKSRTVKALRQIEGDCVVDALISALSEENYTLVYWVTRALGELGDKRAVEPLIEMLKHPYIDARTTAADSLGRLGDERALEALERMRQDDHEENWWGRTASQAAAMAIDKIR